MEHFTDITVYISVYVHILYVSVFVNDNVTYIICILTVIRSGRHLGSQDS